MGMGLITPLFCRHHKMMVMSNNLFLCVCTFTSLLVLLRNIKRTFTSAFWFMCAIISELANSFTRAATLASYLDWLVLLRKMRDRFVWLHGHKHEEHDEKLHFFLGVSFFVGLFGLDFTSLTGFCMCFSSPACPNKLIQIHMFLLGPQIFIIIGSNATVVLIG